MSLALLIGAVVPFVGNRTALADEALPSVWIQISPIVNQVNLNSGEQYDSKLKITNVGAEEFDFKVYASEYYVTDLTYEPIYGQPSPRSEIARWVSFDQTEYKSIKPNEVIEVPYHVAVPADAPGGGQYAVLFAETLGGSNAQGASTAIQTVNRVGSLLYAKMGGETRETGEVTSLTQDGLFFESPIWSETVVKNTGNVDFPVHYSFTVKSLFGDRELYSNSMDKLILPDTSRQMRLEWQDAPLIGLFQVSDEVSFLNKTQASEERLVLIAPLWLLIVVGVVLLLIIVIVVALIMSKVKARRRLRAERARKAEKAKQTKEEKAEPVKKDEKSEKSNKTEPPKEDKKLEKSEESTKSK
jgi:Na+-transporting methylmalonyl-CoA/oxaloacetate decarboxylase gamma subunit